MFTKIKLVLAAVLVLGAGSLAQAANGMKPAGLCIRPAWTASIQPITPVGSQLTTPVLRLRRAVDPQAPSRARADSEPISPPSVECAAE
jgi:hypothetical protein